MRKFKHKQSKSIAEQTDHIRIYKVSTDLGEVTHVLSVLIENTADWEEMVEVITEVKRTKDGVIFKLGEKVKSNGDTLTIQYFTHNGAYVHFKEVDEHDSIDNLVKVKEESNYLITAFRDLRHSTFNHIWEIDNKGFYSCNGFGATSKEHLMNTGDCVKNGSFEIYSVKNSKGEEWNLSDKFDTKIYKNCVITKFELIDGVIGFYAEGKHGFLELDWIIKPKTPLYITTDGLDVYEGDEVKLYLVVNKDNDLISFGGGVLIHSFSESDLDTANRHLTFISAENRDKYIKENQKNPVLVSADDKEVKEGEAIWFSNQWSANWRYLKISSLNPDEKYFSTKEACLEYITDNKPKFSLKEIESCYPSPTNSPLFTTFINNLKKLGK